MRENDKKTTPMMAQYQAVKAQYPDCLLFFRLGDFYEMFQEDARIGARELELTLTTRDRNKPAEEQVPMCGVPYHAVGSYLARLTAKGYKVAICEQMEDPALAKGLVERDIVRIVTPGTVVDEESLDEGANNYLASVYLEEDWAGLAFCDLSTGECCALACRRPDERTRFYSELESRHPREVVVNRAARELLGRSLEDRLGASLQSADEAGCTYDSASRLLEKQFGDKTAALTREEGDGPAVCALGGLLCYLLDTQRTDHISHLNTLRFLKNREAMELDRATRLNLELTETLRGKERRGSLLWALDKTVTAMGRRRLRSWLERPLLSVEEITRRQEAVALFAQDIPRQLQLRKLLGRVGDLERLAARVSCGTAGARELLNLAGALEPLAPIMQVLARVKTPYIKDQLSRMDPLTGLSAELHAAIRAEELPAGVKDGGIIAKGYDPQVDECNDLIENGAAKVVALAEREKARTGIKNLKVGYNKVFGYFIEISNVFKGQVPPEYIRKQTLVNAERYVTPELKELEDAWFNARERRASLEYQIFTRLRDMVMDNVQAIQRDADAIAGLDVLCGFGELARENRYVCPQVDDSGVLDIREGRHPVVERTMRDELFVPNDTHMDDKTNTLLITGPNMAGKSTYMRQVALIVLMAQLGSFVPAQSARIGVVDRVFTRIGASDDLNAGQSTFMVEMMEVGAILREATARSLVIMDEVGRGTSTFDGMAIAQGVLEYTMSHVGAKTLFSTHYHTLVSLERDWPQLKNYSMAVRRRESGLVFLRKLVPGGTDESYGVEVAQLAGLPQAVLERARELLRRAEEELLTRGGDDVVERRARQLEEWRAAEAQRAAQGPTGAEQALEEISRAQPETMSPIEAWQFIQHLKELLKQPEGGGE